MATFKTDGLNQTIASFSKLGHKLQGPMKASVYDGAGTLADAIRQSGNANGIPAGIMNQMYIEKIETAGGTVSTEIGFSGYYTNRYNKEVPCALIVACFESGTSDRVYPKNAFIRKGVRAAKEQALSKMESTFNETVQKIMEE